jgi:hypothetical protein
MTENRREFSWTMQEATATAHQDRTEIKSGEPVLNRDSAQEPDGTQPGRCGAQPSERRAAERRYECLPSNLIII